MVLRQISHPYLAQMAELFKIEGDLATFLAINEQSDDSTVQGLSPVIVEMIDQKRALAQRYCSFGGYERAIPLLEDIAIIHEAKLGSHHHSTLESFRELATCYLAEGETIQALELNIRLLRIEKTLYGTDSELTRATRQTVQSCAISLKRSNGIREFGDFFHKVLIRSADHDPNRQSDYLDRLLFLACRLESRQKFKRAKPLFKRWIEARINQSDPDSEEAFKDSRRYAAFLSNAGEMDQAKTIFGRLVHLRNLKSDLGYAANELRQSLLDYASCLEKMGDAVSALSTTELANRIS